MIKTEINLTITANDSSDGFDDFRSDGKMAGNAKGMMYGVALLIKSLADAQNLNANQIIQIMGNEGLLEPGGIIMYDKEEVYLPSIIE